MPQEAPIQVAPDPKTSKETLNEDREGSDLGVVCVLAAASARAQAQPKQSVQVLTLHTKPEGALDYEAFVNKVNGAAEKIGQTQRSLVFQVTTGGPGCTYMIATCFDKWAETDVIPSTPEILFKALGEFEGGRARRAGRLNIESFDTAAYRVAPDLSTKPKAFDPPPAYLQVIRTYVKPDMIQRPAS
jgi:hypothetical protein